MEIIAESKYIRTSARKIRLVAKSLKGLEVKKALSFLENLDKRASLPLRKTMFSAFSNARNNFNLKEGQIKIKNIQINDGPIYKRTRPISRGQAHPIQKRTSHIRVILEGEETNGTKS